MRLNQIRQLKCKTVKSMRLIEISQLKSDCLDQTILRNSPRFLFVSPSEKIFPFENLAFCVKADFLFFPFILLSCSPFNVIHSCLRVSFCEPLVSLSNACTSCVQQIANLLILPFSLTLVSGLSHSHEIPFPLSCPILSCE